MTSAASGLVLVSPGGVPAALADRLAALLERRLLPPLPADAQAPDQQLQASLGCAWAWLQPLAVPPAQDRPPASCWAELLGAWRLPTCLLVSEAERCDGQARSQVILLQHYRVPLLGWCSVGEPGGQRSAAATDCPGWARSPMARRIRPSRNNCISNTA
ncbi:MAG: hypothetical protein ACKOHJ_08105 [Vulcanococcus sp.]